MVVHRGVVRTRDHFENGTDLKRTSINDGFNDVPLDETEDEIPSPRR